MSDQRKPKRPRIGEDGEFIDPVPVKAKRKSSPYGEENKVFFLVAGFLLLAFGFGLGIMFLLVVNAPDEPMPTLIPEIASIATLDLSPTGVPTITATPITPTADQSSNDCDTVLQLDGEKIGLIAYKDGRALYLVNIDQRVWCQIDVPVYRDLEWSTDGRELAFIGFASGNQQQIFIVNDDGTNLRQITDDSNNYTQPQWSTHDEALVYMRRTPELTQVYMINTDGTDPQLVYQTTLPFGDEPPRWGGGQNILLSYTETLPADSFQQHDIFIHDPYNETVFRVTENIGYDGHAFWLNHYRLNKIVWHSVHGSQSGIYVMDIIGDDADATLISENGAFDPVPNHRQDRILYQTLTDGRARLFTTDINGDNTRLIVEEDRRMLYPQWSHDDSQIAYTIQAADNSFNLIIVDVASGTRFDLSAVADFGNVENFAWRPRAELLATPPPSFE